MSTDKVIQAKIYRLEELRKYQAHYGPNTPYPVIAEINQLEAELQRIFQVDATRRTQVVRKKKKETVPFWQIWKMSQATIDLIATITFIGLVFLLGTIVFAAYIQNRPEQAAAYNNFGGDDGPTATRRPTFTPTPNPNAPAVEAGVVISNGNPPSEIADSASVAFLPTPGHHPTDIPTPVPTLTPTNTPVATPTPPPTDTPPPTNTPRPQPTATPAPTTPTPAPSFPFVVAEQGNRMFQSTSYHVITIYVAVVSEGNIPMGGYKVVGDHSPSGQHAESALSTWNWDVTNCLDCDYVKQGNLKFEPGSFTDGVWNIYLADANGVRVSDTLSLPYSSNPDQWVWDFILFKQK